MEIDSSDNNLSIEGIGSSEHELTDYSSRWEGREVRKISGDSLEIPPLLNSIQSGTTHLPAIASQSPSRIDANVNRSNQEIQGDINSDQPKERQGAVIDVEEKSFENKVREGYGKVVSGEELEKRVQWALGKYRAGQKGKNSEPNNVGQDGSTLNTHNTSPEIKPTYPLSSIDFSKGFVKGLPMGVKDSGIGFLSMLKDITFHPVETGSQVWNSLVLIKDLVRSGEWESLSEALVPEIHQLVTEWETIPSEERGKIAGYAFGKYGADILIPGVLAKLGAKGIKGVQGLNIEHKVLQMTERTLLRESVVGLENSAKATEVVKDISALEKAGIVNEELNAVKNAGLFSGEATAGSLQGQIIASEVSGGGQAVLKEAGIAEAKVGRKDALIIDEAQRIKDPIITEPRNLQEQFTLQEAKAGAGKPCVKLEIKDPNYPPETWQRMQHQHTNPDGSKINIHFWENKQTGERTGFKFKDGDN